jgi:hypothetical protein
LALVVPAGATAATGASVVAEHVCAASASAARCEVEIPVLAGSRRPLARAEDDAPAGLTPAQLWSAYGLTTAVGTSGSQQTVAIVDAFDDPSAEVDLAVYRHTFGLPACTTANGCFRKVSENGDDSYPNENADWSLEESVDLDMVSAACPLCHILLVEASGDSPPASFLGPAENEAAALGATVISNSYDFPENAMSDESGPDQSAYYDHPGIALVGAAGDNGCCQPQLPAALATVTAVGGTTLTAAPSTARGWTETAWSGTQSGCSAWIDKPSWQPSMGCPDVNGTSGDNGVPGRAVADVAAVADPVNSPVAVYDTDQQPGWILAGGTSAATAIIAGFYGLEGDGAGDGGAQWAYEHPAAFNDITSGGDSSLCTAAALASDLCLAGAGFDAVTGLGTPAEGNLGPVVLTGAAASAADGKSAGAVASVNPNGNTASYQFQYGTSTSYGAATTATPAGAGSSPVFVEASLAGLEPGTTYHYRIVAASSGGTNVGRDLTFVTADPTPSKPSPKPKSTRVSIETGSVIARKGAVKLRLACHGSSGRCSGKLSLSAKGGRIAYGSSRYGVRAGHSTSIEIKLSRAVQKRLEQTQPVTVKTRATATDAGKSYSRIVTLRAKRPSKTHR